MNTDAPILIGYDGSENARHAIRRAGELFPGRLTLILCAWEPAESAVALHGGIGSTVGLSANESLRDIDATARGIAERASNEGAEVARQAGLAAQPMVVQNNAPIWETIVQVADEVDAVLIVLGSRGLRGVRSLVLGSVSHQVTHHAHQPVLVIPSPELTEARREGARSRSGGGGIG